MNLCSLATVFAAKQAISSLKCSHNFSELVLKSLLVADEILSTVKPWFSLDNPPNAAVLFF